MLQVMSWVVGVHWWFANFTLTTLTLYLQNKNWLRLKFSVYTHHPWYDLWRLTLIVYFYGVVNQSHGISVVDDYISKIWVNSHTSEYSVVTRRLSWSGSFRMSVSVKSSRKRGVNSFYRLIRITTIRTWDVSYTINYTFSPFLKMLIH